MSDHQQALAAASLGKFRISLYEIIQGLKSMIRNQPLIPLAVLLYFIIRQNLWQRIPPIPITSLDFLDLQTYLILIPAFLFLVVEAALFTWFLWGNLGDFFPGGNWRLLAMKNTFGVIIIRMIAFAIELFLFGFLVFLTPSGVETLSKGIPAYAISIGFGVIQFFLALLFSMALIFAGIQGASKALGSAIQFFRNNYRILLAFAALGILMNNNQVQGSTILLFGVKTGMYGSIIRAVILLGGVHISRILVGKGME